VVRDVTVFADAVGMGNPLRFFGTGEPVQIDDFTLPANCSVEVTFRVFNQQFLLRPDKENNARFLGCLGRAYDRYPALNLHAVDSISNHSSLLATPTSAAVLSDFMRDFVSTLARKTNDARGREGAFIERRYRAIPILDEAKLEERLRYLLTQGTKENLVWSARDWPGVKSIRALTGGPQLVGRWRDRTAEYEPRRNYDRRLARAAKRGVSISVEKPGQIWHTYPIDLVPLPHWKDLKPGQQRSRVAEMIRLDDQETRERHERDGTAPVGVRAILKQDPFNRPAEPKKSPAPPCHTSRPSWGRSWRTLYRAFDERIRAETETIRKAIPSDGLCASMSVLPVRPCAIMSASAPSPSGAGPPAV
jgi:hypothetical protein